MMERVVNEIRQAGMIIQKVIDNRSTQRDRSVFMRIVDINTGIILSNSKPRRKRLVISP